MNQTEQLRETRGASLADCQRLLDGARAEGRDLTVVERHQFDSHRETADQITERIGELTAEVERAENTDMAFRRAALVENEVRLTGGPVETGDYRGRALRALESRDQAAPDSWRQAAVQAVENDASGRVARVAAPLADPAYARAFTKVLRSPTRGHLEWTPEEREAFAAVQESQRTMNIGTNADGKYAVPFALDPTFVITGTGSINPIRKVADVKQCATSAYHGINAAQITASWDPELTAVGDDTPVLTQPAINLYMGRAFIPVSYEALDDIPDLEHEIAKLMADAKDNLESSSFTTGTGSAQPFGAITSVKAVSGSRVAPTTAATYALADVYKVQNALPARHSANASWMANLAILNATRRFGEGTTGSNSAFWADLGGGVPAELAGRAIYENSAMDATSGTSTQSLLYGDFKKYAIVDHIGGTFLEPIQNLFDTTTGRPNASRGFLLHWRVGADVIDANAFRVLYS
jgi:Predicted phage phi-C31 gp36 major capsid-like protein